MATVATKEMPISYLICHMEKYTRQETSPVEKENERDENYEASNPQIDSSRTKNNYHIVFPMDDYITMINNRLSTLTLKRKLRSDAIYMNSFVVGASPDFFQRNDPSKQREFFIDCVKFFSEKYGKENILSAVVHMDETTPHLHLNIVPITNGKLCSKDLFDRTKLSILQTELYDKVGKKWELQRGKEGSQATHLSTAEYKAKKIIEGAEAKATEIEEYKEALKQAEQGEFSWSKGGLKKQIIAERMRNSELEKELKSSHKDQTEVYELYQKEKRLNEEDRRSQQLLEAMRQTNPELYRELLRQTTEKKKSPKSSRRNTSVKD